MFSLPKPLYVLALASAVLMTGTPLAILVGGIVGSQLAPLPALATLPLAVLVFGVAGMASFAARILNRHGYQRLFLTGTVLCVSANTAAVLALHWQSFYLWLMAMALIGSAGACAQQMRFAIQGFLQHQPKLIPVGISVFMLGGVLAAFIGPELATHNVLDFLPTYSTGFILASLLQVFALAVVFSLPAQAQPMANNMALTGQNHFGLLAIAASVTAYGIMSFVMTATPVSMHQHQGHSLNATKNVIQWHILAMFLPSLLTGKLIQLAGINKSLWLGISLYLCVFIFTLQGHAFMHYAIGLILLGLGWNILFTAGSTLAATHQDPAFKGKHDTWVFSIQAIASLSAGFVLYQLSWQAVQWLAIAGLLPLVVLLLNNIKTIKRLKLSSARGTD